MKHMLKSWIIAVVLLSASITAPTFAISSPERSLGISPLRNELTIAPGTSFNGKLTLNNNGKEQISISMDTQLFSVSNNVYDYSFDPTGPEAQWVTFQKESLTIEPGKSSVISYAVAVPNDAEPGGHYLTLFASSGPTASNGVVSVNRVASLLYITITGDVSRTGKVLTLNSPLVSFGDTSWTATIQNSGSAHFHSIYSVNVTPLFSDTAIKSTQGDSLILPATVRLLTQPIDHPQWLGIYRLDYTIGLGDTPAHQETRWLLYLPPFQSLLVLGIIISLFVLRSKRSKTKHRNG